MKTHRNEGRYDSLFADAPEQEDVALTRDARETELTASVEQMRAEDFVAEGNGQHPCTDTARDEQVLQDALITALATVKALYHEIEALPRTRLTNPELYEKVITLSAFRGSGLNQVYKHLRKAFKAYQSDVADYKQLAEDINALVNAGAADAPMEESTDETG